MTIQIISSASALEWYNLPQTEWLDKYLRHIPLLSDPFLTIKIKNYAIVHLSGQDLVFDKSPHLRANAKEPAYSSKNICKN